MSPVNTDTSFIENRAPNVAVQFRDRVHKSPSSEAYRYPAADGEPWKSLTWKETLSSGASAFLPTVMCRASTQKGRCLRWQRGSCQRSVRGGGAWTITTSSQRSATLPPCSMNATALATPRSRSASSPTCRPGAAR